jgi:predicted secreted hydrolase
VQIGPNWARGDLHRYELHAEVDGLAADLTFTGSVPAWRPGAGKNFYDDARTRYFAWLPAIPFGKAEGALTYDGQTHPVTGAGYHDHNWGNIGLNDVMSHWYWGRAHVGDFTLIFVDMVSVRAYGGVKLPVFLLAQGDHILTGDGGPLVLQTSDFVRHSNGRSYPQALDWRWQTAEGSVSLALRRPQMIEAASLLGFLPTWQRWLARLFANPYYFRFSANLELTVHLGGVHAAESGTALYELMILR